MYGGLNDLEYRYLSDLAALDAIHLGMLDPSILVANPDEVRDRLAERGMVRIGAETIYGKPVVWLTSKGLRTLRRVTNILDRA